MCKKVSIIVILIALSLVFYGCSSMKHSTVVLYVSHKLEGPLYMPQAETPVSAQNSDSRANQGSETNSKNQTSQSSQSKQQDTKQNTKQDTTNDKAASQSKQDNVVKENGKANQSKQDNVVKENSKASQSKQDSVVKENGKTIQSNQASKSKPNQIQDNTKDIQVLRTNTYGNNYKTRVMRRGELLTLNKPIRFAFEKYDITSYYDDSVEFVANYLKEYTNVRLVVEGHTDRVGEFGFNKNLSIRRARTAISKLVRAGVDKDRLLESGVSYRFAEYNFNRLNRRVEFIIIQDEEDLTNYRAEIAE